MGEKEIEKTEKKKKHIVLRILLIVVAVLAAAAVALIFWQWDNIQALRYASSASQEQIAEDMKENEQEFEAAAEEYGLKDVSISDEEAEALSQGVITIDEMAQQILNRAANEVSSTKGASLEGSAANDPEVQRLIASLYALRGSYSSKLSGLLASAKSEYAALPPEQRTGTARRNIMSKAISSASAMEGECDSQVSGIVSSLRSRLKELGQDEGLADRVMSAYQQEKKLRKASYMAQFS